MRILIKLFIFCALWSNQSFANTVNITSFAGVVEPLMPKVVNIYTIKHKRDLPLYGNSNAPTPLKGFSNMLRQQPANNKNTPIIKKPMSLGSGFIVDAQGHIVTNYHVIDGSDEIYVKLSNNKEYSAKLVGTDPKTDLALLKIHTSEKLQYVKLADSSIARVGDVVIAIGNPLGFGGTVTTGIISSKGRDLGENPDQLVDDFIQTDAAINRGNSGGPLFDIKGRVVGVNTAVPNINGGANIGIGFAIPSNTVADIVEQLKAKGKIHRGKLDIFVQEITPELADAMNLGIKRGVIVGNVTKNGAGEKAGLKRGDLIHKFNGMAVTSARKLLLYVADCQIDEEVKLTIYRNKKEMVIKAKISAPKQQVVAENMLDTNSLIALNGITFSNLTENIRLKLDLKSSEKGVALVKFNQKILNLDLKLGDLVLAADQKNIDNISDFAHAYKQAVAANKKNIVLLVKRQNINLFVALPIKK